MTKQLFLWFLVNALLPMAIPALFLASIAWFKDGSFPVIILLNDFINNGFYIFSASALVFSLYEEYGMCTKCIGIGMQTWIVLLMIATLGMFYQIQSQDATYLNNHQIQFGVIWCMTAISAGIIKYRIIKYKRKLAI